MKVLNIHRRIVHQPKNKVTELIKTLATDKDRVWPKEKWPPMKFENGIKVGARGGHGPIRYSVEKYDPDAVIQFRFSKPIGFNGSHKFEVSELTNEKTEIKHTIEMQTSGKGTLLWIFGIRSLHNALIEDGFDNLENNFLEKKKSTHWNWWVRFLRRQFLKRRSTSKS